MQCSDEQCARTIEYTDDEYTMLAVFRGVIVGKAARLTVAPRQNSFIETDDGRFLYLPCEGKQVRELHTAGSIVFREYDYALHYLKAKERSDEEPVKFDMIIAKGDKTIVITGLRPRVKTMQYILLGKPYDFIGNEEYHACNHCKKGMS